jgi:hypothetical protein
MKEALLSRMLCEAGKNYPTIKRDFEMEIQKELDKLEEALNLECIVKKAKENYSWSDQETEYALKWYVRHWYLCVKYPSEPLASISKMVDDLWHQHILDTRKYATDCEQISGTFLNHTPIYDKPKTFEIAAYDNTVEIYKKEFKTLPSDMRQTSDDYPYRTLNCR